jgi:molybdopterin-guanine dinucleotide biosynthesis protein A
MRIDGVILAGGGGRRMGGADKALLPLAGQPLILNAIARLEPQVHRLCLSANGDPARLAFTGLPVLADDVSQGPLSGILAALEASEGADALVSVAVDTPFFPGDLVPRLWMAADGGLAYATCGGRAHPTFALWPLALRAALRDWLAAGKARMMDFCAAHGAVAAPFPGGTPDPFFNLNTQDDLAAAEQAIRCAG